MPTGPGFWLDPSNGVLHRVVTHNDWLLDPKNQAKVGLTPKQVRVLESLDAVREIDEIRMVGVMSGLIRIRDYGNRVSVQFHASPPEVGQLLQSVVEAMPAVTCDNFPCFAIQNLRDDATIHIHLADLESKLRAGDSVLQPRAEPISYNESLRRKMDRLLGKPTC